MFLLPVDFSRNPPNIFVKKMITHQITKGNNIKTKLVPFNIKIKSVSYNMKIKPNTRLNNRTQQILSVIFMLFSVNLMNCECF